MSSPEHWDPDSERHMPEQMNRKVNPNVFSVSNYLNNIWQRDAKGTMQTSIDTPTRPHRGIRWDWVKGSSTISKLFGK